MENKEQKDLKKLEAFKKAKQHIKFGNSYFKEQVEQVDKLIDMLDSEPSKYFAKTHKPKTDIEKEEQGLKARKRNAVEKQEYYEKRREPVSAALIDFEEVLKTKGSYKSQQFGDENAIKNIFDVKAEGQALKLIGVYRKELAKATVDIGTHRDKVRDLIQKNQKYLLDNKGLEIFGQFGEITQGEFLEMMEEEQRTLEQHPELQQTHAELMEEQKEMCHANHPEKGRIDTVLDEKNGFNFSSKDRKNIEKCSKMYSSIAKQEQLIKKIEILYKRLTGKEKEFPQMCKKLAKMRQKAEKTIEKLEKKVQKPYKQSKVEELNNLVKLRKQESELKESILQKQKEIEVFREKKTALEAEKASLDEKIKAEKTMMERQEIGGDGTQIAEIRPDISALIERSKELEKQLNGLSCDIIGNERSINVDRERLGAIQQEKGRADAQLEKYTTKAVVPRTTKEVVVSTEQSPDKNSQDNKKALTDTLAKQVYSAEEREKVNVSNDIEAPKRSTEDIEI